MEKEETTVSRNVGAEELKCKLCVGKNGGASHDDDVVNLYGSVDARLSKKGRN
jgi:hypothetical protein